MTENNSSNLAQKPTSRRHPPIWQIVLGVISVALAVVAFFFTRSFVTGWRLTSLPGVAVDSSNPTPAVGVTPTLAAPEDQLPPAWDGGSRVNILFIGLDYRDWEAGQGAPRSDTMIVFTIDPISKTAGILSIPRDMWVNIPGYGYSRINTAYSTGEGDRLPGGGPGLAMKTVEQFLGVPIQYYAQVDFNTFVDAINTIGGIDVQVDQQLVLDPIGSGADHVVVMPGLRHMDGDRALAFARTRKTEGGDVDRAKRQQAVIFAIRNKVFSPEYFPTLIAQAPQLYSTFSAGIHTNLSLEDAIKLAVLAQQVPADQIKTGVIDYSMVTLNQVTLSGQAADIFKPIPDKIRVLRDEIFTSSGPTSPIAQGDPAELMKAEGARVRILNGSQVSGMAQRTAEYLGQQGVGVTEIGNAAQISDSTQIVMYTDKLYTLRYLMGVFGTGGGGQLIIKPDSSSAVDVEVRVGNDWAYNNPMPPG